MTRARLTCACLVAIAAVAGYLCGRLTTPKYTASPPSPPAPESQTSLPPLSATRIAGLRADVAEHDRLAGQVLTWLESLQGTPVPDPNQLPYDAVAVYHAVKFLGEVRYVPAVPFLIREAFERNSERKLWITNPEIKTFGSPDIGLEKRSPVFGALIRIGPPSAPPLVDEYLRLWSWPPGQERDIFLSVVKYALEEDALVGAALRHIHKRLVKANFAHIDRDELDALQHLKRELLKGLD